MRPTKVITGFKPRSFDPVTGSLEGTVTNYNLTNMKIAFSGSSGSGKTTLVEFVAKSLNLRHISGSAGDVKTEADKMLLQENPYNYPGGGHSGVIRYSALNPEYGLINQQLLLQRRHEIILGTHPVHGEHGGNFVTDRSPADNIVYFISQVGYHPMVTDEVTEAHLQKAQKAWDDLTHVIYVKAVQPKEVERNHSRIANKYYQKSIDALFEYWIKNYLIPNSVDGPEVLIIDYWDLDQRKEEVLKFLS